MLTRLKLWSLGRKLRDPRHDVRAAAVERLRLLGDERAVPLLAAALESFPNPTGPIIDALTAYGATEYLLPLLNSGLPEYRVAAVAAVATLGGGRAADALLQSLKAATEIAGRKSFATSERDVWAAVVRATAAAALRAGGTSVVPELVRRACEFGGEGVVPALAGADLWPARGVLLDALRREDNGTYQALNLLAPPVDAATVAALAAILERDPRPGLGLHKAALARLVALDPTAAVPVLRRLLVRPTANGELRHAAIDALVARGWRPVDRAEEYALAVSTRDVARLIALGPSAAASVLAEDGLSAHDKAQFLATVGDASHLPTLIRGISYEPDGRVSDSPEPALRAVAAILKRAARAAATADLIAAKSLPNLWRRGDLVDGGRDLDYHEPDVRYDCTEVRKLAAAELARRSGAKS